MLIVLGFSRVIFPLSGFVLLPLPAITALSVALNSPSMILIVAPVAYPVITAPSSPIYFPDSIVVVELSPTPIATFFVDSTVPFFMVRTLLLIIVVPVLLLIVLPFKSSFTSLLITITELTSISFWSLIIPPLDIAVLNSDSSLTTTPFQVHFATSLISLVTAFEKLYFSSPRNQPSKVYSSLVGISCSGKVLPFSTSTV